MEGRPGEVRIGRFASTRFARERFARERFASVSTRRVKAVPDPHGFSPFGATAPETRVGVFSPPPG